MEIWKPVPEFDNYEVSDQGRVRSLPMQATHYKGTTFMREGRVLRGTPNKHGHLHVTLVAGARKKMFYIHTLVALAFIGPSERGEYVKHRDDDPENMALDNLLYTTQAEDKRKPVSRKNYVDGPRLWFNI